MRLKDKQRFDVFLCHRRRDGQMLALAVRERLLARGAHVFMDVSDQAAGVFGLRLLNAVGNSKYFVLVLSEGVVSMRPDASIEDWVRKEIQRALDTTRSITCIVKLPAEGSLREEGIQLVASIHPDLVFDFDLLNADDILNDIDAALALGWLRLVSYWLRRFRSFFVFAVSLLVLGFVIQMVVDGIGRSAVSAQASRGNIESALGEARRNADKLRDELRDVERRRDSGMVPDAGRGKHDTGLESDGGIGDIGRDGVNDLRLDGGSMYGTGEYEDDGGIESGAHFVSDDEHRAVVFNNCRQIAKAIALRWSLDVIEETGHVESDWSDRCMSGGSPFEWLGTPGSTGWICEKGDTNRCFELREPVGPASRVCKAAVLGLVTPGEHYYHAIIIVKFSQQYRVIELISRNRVANPQTTEFAAVVLNLLGRCGIVETRYE